MNKYSDIKLRKTIFSVQNLPNVTSRSHINDSFDSSLKKDLAHSLSKDSVRISNFSLLENSKMQNLSDKISLTPKSPTQSIKLHENNSPNFKGLIEKLDKISEKPNFNRVKFIKQGKEYQSQQSATHFCYYQIDCRNKKSPMNILVKRKSGLLKFFLSKSKNFPNEDNFEHCFIADFFEVTEKTSWFQENLYFMSVLALENSQFTLLITFGKGKTWEKSQGPQLDLANCDESRRNLAQRVENIKKQRKLKALQSNRKNFIELNKFPSSPTTKIQAWEEKHKSVVRKKVQFYTEKIIKAQLSVNKKKQRLQKLEKDKSEIKLKPKLRKSQKFWIQLIFVSKLFFSVQSLIETSKKSKFLRLKTMGAVRTIQLNFRAHLNFLSHEEIAVLKCRNHLSLMRGMVFPWNKKQICQPFKAFFKSVYLAARAQKAFGTYINRVIYVQYQVKKFLKRTKTRFLDLVRSWNQVLSKLIIENSKESQNPYTKITPQYRDPIIRRYITECMQMHEKKLRVYLSAYSMGAKCRKSFVSKKSILYPKFKYSPEEETMKKMINEALLNMKNQIN